MRTEESIQAGKMLRKEKIKARNRLAAAEREWLSLQIVERICSTEVFQKASTVMLYRAIKGEVDLRALEKIAVNLNKQLVYPLCIGEGEMIALLPEDETAWQSGFCGIEEPIRMRSVEISPEQIDLVICPCTVFDEACGRMGMGAGFYDRFLPACTNACIVAAAFEVQKAVHIVKNPWDCSMDMIFTEKAIYKKDVNS